MSEQVMPDKVLVWVDIGYAWALREEFGGKWDVMIIPKRQAVSFARAVLSQAEMAPEADVMEAG